MTNPVDLPQYAPAPTLPAIGSASFATDVQNFFAWQAGDATGANVAGLAQSAATNAKSAQESAIAAEAAVAGIDVPMWASGNNYQVGRGVKSPAAIAAGTAPIYICKVAISGGTTDPYNDPAHWSIFTVSGGVGGAVYTTSTTLTSASPFAISISGGAGVWLKLPDATTLTTGIRHTVRNVGDNDLTLIDASGAHIGFIRPQSGTTIALSDNSTAAGKWAGDWESVGITADLQFGAAIAGLQNVKQIVQLDATRTMILTGGSNGQNLVAAIYDTATQLLGAPVTVKTGIYAAMAVKSATDQVLVVSFDASSNIYASVLTISGKEITAVTTSNTTTSGTISFQGYFAIIGSAIICSYLTTNGGVVRAITISGATASIGGEQIAGASGAPRLYATGSILRAVRVSNGSTVICTPYSVSGNTLTAGTAASTNTAASEGVIRSFQYSGGDIGVFHAYGGYYVESIFKLTTTTEAVLSTNIRSHGTLPAGSISVIHHDFSIVNSTKIVFMCVVNSDGSTFSVNTVVNTNGTPSAGTAVDYLNGSTSFSTARVNEIKSTNANEVGFATGTSVSEQIMFFDSSGTSPTRNRVYQITGSYTGDSISSRFKNQLSVQSPYLLSNSRAIYRAGVFSSGYATPCHMISTNGLSIAAKIPPIIRGTVNYSGENNQSMWVATQLTSSAEGSLGVALQRVEVAQI